MARKQTPVVNEEKADNKIFTVKKTVLKGALDFCETTLQMALESVGGKIDEKALYIPSGLSDDDFALINRLIVLISGYQHLLKTVLENWEVLRNLNRSKLKRARISNSKTPPLRQKQKDIPR